ncbi:MAG: hypothetical protein QM504_10975 [Pseudomonadota bacterium]
MTIKSTKAVSIKKSTNGKATPKEVKLPTAEQIQEVLDRNIQNFREKNQLIKNRTKFLRTKEDLTKFISDQGADYEEFMEDSGKKLVFQDDVNYRSEGISIKNNYLVREFAQFMIGKINSKLAEIEKQIMV